MKHIFYFFAIVAILWEMYTLFNLRNVHNFTIELNERANIKPRKKLSFTQTIFTFLMLMYTGWILLGLYSSQWLFFLVILITSVIPKKLIGLRFFDSVFTLVVLILMILNVYHFKVNNLELLLRIIS
jgi:hypothetical protein